MAEDRSFEPRERLSNRSLTLRLAALALGMFGFGYLLVPLYDLLCEITGIGGRTSDTVAAMPQVLDEQRAVEVEFLATVNQYAPWEFRPEVAAITLHPGELATVKFKARNLTNRPLTGQAIPSVAPAIGAQYLKKTDCFCFREQDFAAEETRDLVVQFYVDPQLPTLVDRLTLSYTMFMKPAA
jgi:cytochrome c oxidase assembly protein subunit 11